MTQYTPYQEAAIVRWYDFEAPEEFLREMEEVHNRSFTPREAYELYHSSSAPAQESQGVCVAAPVEVVQEQGTLTLDQFQKFIAQQHAGAIERYVELCQFLGDRYCPSDIAKQYKYMSQLADCQDLLGKFFEAQA